MSEVKRIGAVWNDICESIQLRESSDGEFVKYEDYAELKAQRDAMATENAELKELYRQSVKELDDTCFEIGMMRGEKSMEYPAPQTPATDAYLNSVRAEGVEMFSQAIRGGHAFGDRTIDLANMFAAQLRAGEPS